jgi:hypothetical protein
MDDNEALMQNLHKPLPVFGYTEQSEDKIAVVNQFKRLEEIVLRHIDNLEDHDTDHRWLSIGRTHIEQGFMAINRSVFRPTRVKLPSDSIDGT